MTNYLKHHLKEEEIGTAKQRNQNPFENFVLKLYSSLDPNICIYSCQMKKREKNTLDEKGYRNKILILQL